MPLRWSGTALLALISAPQSLQASDRYLKAYLMKQFTGNKRVIIFLYTLAAILRFIVTYVERIYSGIISALVTAITICFLIIHVRIGVYGMVSLTFSHL